MDAQRCLDDFVIKANLQDSLDIVRLRILTESLTEERRQLLPLLRAATKIRTLLLHPVGVKRIGVVKASLRAQVSSKRLSSLLDPIGHTLELAAHAKP